MDGYKFCGFVKAKTMVDGFGGYSLCNDIQIISPNFCTTLSRIAEICFINSRTYYKCLRNFLLKFAIAGYVYLLFLRLLEKFYVCISNVPIEYSLSFYLKLTHS